MIESEGKIVMKNRITRVNLALAHEGLPKAKTRLNTLIIHIESVLELLRGAGKLFFLHVNLTEPDQFVTFFLLRGFFPSGSFSTVFENCFSKSAEESHSASIPIEAPSRRRYSRI